MVLAGTVQNGVIVILDGKKLPEGTRVEVLVHDELSEETPTLRDRLMKLAGSVDDLPPDMARNHDHYLHGAPKK